MDGSANQMARACNVEWARYARYAQRFVKTQIYLKEYDLMVQTHDMAEQTYAFTR